MKVIITSRHNVTDHRSMWWLFSMKQTDNNSVICTINNVSVWGGWEWKFTIHLTISNQDAAACRSKCRALKQRKIVASSPLYCPVGTFQRGQEDVQHPDRSLKLTGLKSLSSLWHIFFAIGAMKSWSVVWPRGYSYSLTIVITAGIKPKIRSV